MSWNPFSKGVQMSLSDLQDEMNRVFNRMWHGSYATPPLDGQDWAPCVDLADEPTRFVLRAEVPGLSVDDIEVTYEQGSVVLRGRKLSDRGEEGQRSYLCRERRFGQFLRRIAVPETVDFEKISASCQRGVLEVVLPKKEPDVSRRIQVREESEAPKPKSDSK